MNSRLERALRIFAASVCLVAVLAVQAPFAVAYLASRGMGCCTADHCSVPKHHHRPAPRKSGHAVDCGHGSRAEMDCAMSCCDNEERQIVPPAAFLVPAPTAPCQPEVLAAIPTPAVRSEIPCTKGPLSPPPRLSLPS